MRQQTSPIPRVLPGIAVPRAERHLFGVDDATRVVSNESEQLDVDNCAISGMDVIARSPRQLVVREEQAERRDIDANTRREMGIHIANGGVLTERVQNAVISGDSHGPVVARIDDLAGHAAGIADRAILSEDCHPLSHNLCR